MGIKRRNNELKKYLQNMKGKDWKVEKNSVKVIPKEHVWCFVGDMAAEMGCFDEAIKYSIGHKLPITFIIENNKLGCETPTNEVWNLRLTNNNLPNVITYEYIRHYPHCGTGDWVIFKKKFKSTGNYDAYK